MVCHTAMATTPEIFSASTHPNDLIPVQVYNNRSKGYAIKMNPATDYADKAVNSGSCGYLTDEVWYLVGTAESFKMYSHTAGMKLALTLSGTTDGAAATLTPSGTEL